MSSHGAIRRWGGLLFAILLFAAGGCAAGGMGGAGGEGSVGVEVENNLIPPTSLTIYAVPEVGVRRLIGTVPPSATRVLRFDPVGASGQYQFVAETTGGADIVSNPVTVTQQSMVNWDLTANIATVSDVAE